MSGYGFYVLARVAPPNGEEIVLDCEQLTFAPGPTQRSLSYALDQKTREDVNGRLRVRRRGFRPEVSLTFIDGGDMLDSELVAQLVNAFADPQTAVFISLDGGAVWREAALTKFSGPKPIKGKPFAGAQYDLTLQCVDLIPEIPGLGAGNW